MIAKRTTITDVAQRAGVSIKTVSRVFNREPHVRPSTIEKVLAAAEALNYHPNLSARRLASNQTYVIGMLYDNPNSDYVTDVQYGSLQACREHGYNLLIHPCKADSAELMEEVVSLHRQVDGFIMLQPVSDLHELCQFLLEHKVACARVSQRPFEGFPWISVGDSEAADQMTEHLLGLGHRRIGFIIGHPEHGTSHDRLAGYRSALARHNIEYDDTLVEQGRFDYASGFSCARKLLSLEPRPTAIFASNDPMAMGVLSAAHEIGLAVPRQLSVSGFDDSPLARHAWPPLTTVRQPITEVARLATDVLMKRLRGRFTGDSDHRLQAELVRRDSTGRPG
ncbi:MAG: LacI family DNA-binding transcriptional regulator [Acidobacteriota bacterium]|nr:LacI family DNA-binding transcriptional regulator [Acidobacteriota bacterium]MDH3785382.1 LacI family DNA-binding transcriptional regulator [Acidobacteriota bacterium]